MVPMHHGCVVITLSRTWRSLGKIEHNVGGHGLAQRSDMKFLSPDSGLMRGWNNLTDGVWINILMLVTSIPLVTVGAALTAGHDAARKTLAGEGHVTTNYFRSFKSNFVKSTVQWLIFGVALAVLSYAWVVLQIVPLLIPKFGFTIVWIMGFEWVWAL